MSEPRNKKTKTIIMKMLFQAASAAAFCSLALSGINHAQSAEYIDKRLKQIDDNIAKFEMKMDEAGCAAAEAAQAAAGVAALV